MNNVSVIMFLSLIIFSPYSFSTENSLFYLEKKAIIGENPFQEPGSIFRMASCQIDRNFQATYKIFNGTREVKELGKKQVMALEDQVTFNQIIQVIHQYSSNQIELVKEFDFTGRLKNEMGVEYLKEGFGYFPLESQNFVVFKQKVSSIDYYDGPRSSELRKLILKYCFLYL